jgi:hypothetical protein
MKNKYHLKIIVGDLVLQEETVEADGFSEFAGAYRFYKNVENGGATGEAICYYPIGRTIIDKIEQNGDTH